MLTTLIFFGSSFNIRLIGLIILKKFSSQNFVNIIYQVILPSSVSYITILGTPGLKRC